MDYKPEHAARALEITERLSSLVAPHVEYGELIAILRDPQRWKKAHALFNKIRVNITLPLERQKKPDLDAYFACVAECAAKTAYNCSGCPAPFDEDSFEWLLKCERQFIDKLNETRATQSPLAMRLLRKTAVWLLVICCVATCIAVFVRHWTPPWVVSDLSMRFTHPELYESRDGLPMYTALYELRRRGLLHRGMDATEIQKLLGEPPEKSQHQTENDHANLLWTYHLHASTLTIEFSPEGSALSFRESPQGDKPRQDEVW